MAVTTGLQLYERVSGDLHEIGRLSMQHQPPRLKPYDIQQILCQPVEPIRRHVDFGERLLLPGGLKPPLCPHASGAATFAQSL